MGRSKDVYSYAIDLRRLATHLRENAEPGSEPANGPLIRFVNAMLIFASHRLRNRISSSPVAAMAMIMMAAAIMMRLGG